MGEQPPSSPELLGDILISARSFDEYRAMFRLRDDELDRGPVLDCPSGAASFAAEAASLGTRVVAADVAYALDPDDLLARARADAVRANAVSRAHPSAYEWRWFRDVEHHLEVRTAASERFAAHFAGHPGGYVAAALPELPFPDGCFSLTLSSHLLFCWADRFDPEFHVAALVELARVTTGEVRVFPLLDPNAKRYEHLDEVRRGLARAGIASEVRRVDYVVQPGGGELFACQRQQ